MDFPTKYRPRKFENMYGSGVAIKMLTSFFSKVDPPKAIILTGPSGCGKTTAARIIARMLKCKKTDFQEINCAIARGIDEIRGNDNVMWAKGMYGTNRIFYYDEVHCLTRDAQSALLKMLEDPPDHVFFMLATNHPSKMLRTILTRCKAVDFKALTKEELHLLIKEVLKKEDAKLSKDLIAKVALCAEGSARMALQHLERVLNLKTDEDRFELLDSMADGVVEGIELIRFIMGVPIDEQFKTDTYKKACKMIANLQAETENIRLGVLGYASAMLLKGFLPRDKQLRCLRVIRCFRDNFFDIGPSRAGLLAACYEVITSSDLP